MKSDIDEVKVPNVCTTKGVVKAKFVSSSSSRTLTRTMIACREVAHTQALCTDPDLLQAHAAQGRSGSRISTAELEYTALAQCTILPDICAANFLYICNLVFYKRIPLHIGNDFTIR